MMMEQDEHAKAPAVDAEEQQREALDSDCERLATLPRPTTCQELRIELQRVPSGHHVVSLRLWTVAGGEAQPLKHRGFALWNVEISSVIVALVQALDRFREAERAQRMRLEGRNAEDRRHAEADRRGHERRQAPGG